MQVDRDRVEVYILELSEYLMLWNFMGHLGSVIKREKKMPEKAPEASQCCGMSFCTLNMCCSHWLINKAAALAYGKAG